MLPDVNTSEVISPPLKKYWQSQTRSTFKASESYGISNTAIQHLPRKAIVGLTNIANVIFKLGLFLLL